MILTSPPEGRSVLARFLRALADLVEAPEQLPMPTAVSSPEPVPSPSAGRQQGEGPNLNPTETAILAALIEAQRPLKAVVIAKRAGCSCNSHFRGVLSSLRERGLVRHDEEGYLPTTC